jgi:hypothetical protein
MDRAQLQQLAELRLADAKVLIEASRWGAAYYLLGYCIECALKACAAKQFLLHEVPEKGFVNSFYNHDLEKLLAISNVKAQLESRTKSDSNFRINWSVVKDWKADRRYDPSITEALARGMYEAVTNSASGVLPWLRTQW